MRTPISGIFATMPKDYKGISEIEFISERPRFTYKGTGAAADSMYDVGNERPVISSMASSNTHTLVLYSFGSGLSQANLNVRPELPTDTSLRLDVFTNPDAAINSHTLNVSLTRQTRASIRYTGSKFYIAYISGSSCVVREVTTTGTLPGGVTSYTHGVATGDLVGAVASFGASETDIWISYRVGQNWYAKQLSTGNVYFLTADYGLKWWHNTGFSIVYVSGKYVLAYQHRPGLAACRTIQDNRISGPLYVMASSDDYAYQFVRFTGMRVTNSRIFALVERGIYNSDGVPSHWVTNLMWTPPDYLAWADWVGVCRQPVRGNLDIQNGNIVIASVGQFFQSSGVRLLGAASWQNIPGVYGWSSDSGLNEASGGRLNVARQSGQTYPDAGDIVRRKFRISGTDFTNVVANDAVFIMSTESIDRPIDSVSGEVEINQMTSRGPVKPLLSYQASIDDILDSGISRYDNFTYHTIVSEAGNWDVSNNRVSVTDHKGAFAVAKMPDSLPFDDFLMQFRIYGTYGYGVVFYEDLDNYYLVAVRDVAGTRKIEIVRRRDAQESVVGSVAVPFGYNGQMMARYTKGVLEVFAGTASGYYERINLTASGIDCRSERIWCGFGGYIGDTYGELFVRSGYPQQTIRTICKTIAGRCGIEMSVPALEDVGTVTDYNGTVKTEYFDVVFTPSNLTTLYLGSQSSGSHVSGVKVVVADTHVSIYDASVGTLIFHMNEGVTYGVQCRLCIMPDELNRYTIAQIYVNDCLLGASVMPYKVPAGYVNMTGPVTSLKVHDLSYGIISHIWQYATSGADNIRKLVNPMLYVLVESPDYTLRLMKMDSSRDNAGNIESTVRVLDDVPDDNAWGSVIKVEGAEVFGIHVEESMLHLGMRPVTVSSPYLWSEEECVSLGGRYGQLFRNKRNGKILSGFLNPTIELLDTITLDGNTYVVESIEYNATDGRNGQAQMRIHARSA